VAIGSIPSTKQNRKKKSQIITKRLWKAEGVAQMVEHLPTKCKAPSSSHSTAKNFLKRLWKIKFYSFICKVHPPNFMPAKTRNDEQKCNIKVFLPQMSTYKA
jgi:hypothetical protein